MNISGESAMRAHKIFLVTALCFLAAGSVLAQQMGSGLTYQGTFADAGVPANGNYDFEFALYAQASAGTAQAVIAKSVAVNGGLVNTELDFGAPTFNGQAKWIEVRLRPAGSSDPYTVLSPRQSVTAVPYALGLRMPFQRTVGTQVMGTSAEPAFRITSVDGGTAIAGVGLVNNTNFPAVEGTAPSGVGVKGTTSTGLGLSGVAEGNGTGVRGQSLSSGDGVRGLSASGHGVHGVGFYGGWFQGTVGIKVEGNHVNPTGIVEITDLNTTSEGNLIVAKLATLPASTVVFRVNTTGYVFANGGYVTGGADIAEYVPSNELLEAGEVAEIDPLHASTLRRSSRANSTSVAGVVSTRPGLTLNGSMSEHDAQKDMPRLALSGRVPVKVTAENGVIRAGDLLVSSSRPGHAMRAPESPRAGTVIGKAMHGLDGDSGRIEMLVMLR